MTIQKFHFRRSFLWFHHIYSSIKKRNINQLAKQYKETGFCVTGKPGIIVLEGRRESVSDYIATLKSWNWQRMIVRYSAHECFDDDADSFAEAAKYKKWTFVDIAPHSKGGMKEVYDLLEMAELESFYKMIVHINTPIDATGIQQDSKKMEQVLKCLSEHKKGTLLNVNVKPNAKETAIVSLDDNVLNIRIAALPSNGAANKELCTFIAKIVQCKKSDVVIQRGHSAKNKLVMIQNNNIKQIDEKLKNAVGRN